MGTERPDMRLCLGPYTGIPRAVWVGIRHRRERRCEGSRGAWALECIPGERRGAPSALFVPDSQISQFLVGVRPDIRIDLNGSAHVAPEAPDIAEMIMDGLNDIPI